MESPESENDERDEALKLVMARYGDKWPEVEEEILIVAAMEDVYEAWMQPFALPIVTKKEAIAAIEWMLRNNAAMEKEVRRILDWDRIFPRQKEFLHKLHEELLKDE